MALVDYLQLARPGQGRPRLRVLAGAVLISLSPVLVKLAAADGVGPTAIAFWRTGIGALLLFILARAGGRRLRLPTGAFVFSLLAGIFFFVDLACWHRSIVLAGAGMATILGNTQVFATAVLGRFVFGERLGLRFTLAAVAAFGGVVLLVGVGSRDVRFSPTYLRGVALGLATALAYAAYIVSLKKGNARAVPPDLVAFMAWTSLFSALFLGPAALFEQGGFLPDGVQGLAALCGLGLLIQAAAWLLITAALPAVPTARAGLVLLLQPVLATGWGVLLFAERLGPLQVLGAVVTIAAMYAGGLRPVPRRT